MDKLDDAYAPLSEDDRVIAQQAATGKPAAPAKPGAHTFLLPSGPAH